MHPHHGRAGSTESAPERCSDLCTQADLGISCMLADEVGLGKTAHKCVVSERHRAPCSRVVATAKAGPSRSQFPGVGEGLPVKALAITSREARCAPDPLNSFDVQVEPPPGPGNAPLFDEAFSASLCCYPASDGLSATITVVSGSGRFEGRPRVLQSKGLSHLSEHTISWAHRWISAWVTDLRREDQQRQRTALSPRRAAAMREEDRFVSAGRLRKFLKRADCGDRQNTGHDSGARQWSWG
jgi:hypothetical protein